MFLMSVGIKITIICVACLAGIYLLACAAAAIFFYILMLKREKNSYRASHDLLDFKVVGMENSELFPEVKLLTQAQVDLANYLKDKPQEYLEIKSDRGIRLVGWYIKNQNNNQDHPKVLIFCHGWKSSGISDFAACSPFYFEEGYDVLLVDHQAHGHSEGKYLGFGVLDSKNMLKWVNLVDQKHQGNCDIYLHGVSMGANTLMLLSAMDLPKSVKGICADCGFTSGYEELDYLTSSRKLGFLLTKYIIWLVCKIRCRYDLKTSSVDALKHANVPVLFIHGDKDNFVPCEHSKRNYEACTSKKQLKIFSGGTHAACYVKNKEEYKKTVLNFFSSLD